MGGPRSHMPHCSKTKTKNRSDIVTNSINNFKNGPHHYREREKDTGQNQPMEEAFREKSGRVPNAKLPESWTLK